MRCWGTVGVVVCLQRGADCLHMVQLMPLHSQTPLSLVSFKSRLVLPFWQRLTQVVVQQHSEPEREYEGNIQYTPSSK